MLLDPVPFTDDRETISANFSGRRKKQIREALNVFSGRVRKVLFFFNIVQKVFDPPPSFEHYVVNFSEGISTTVRKRLSQQLSTK